MKRLTLLLAILAGTLQAFGSANASGKLTNPDTTGAVPGYAQFTLYNCGGNFPQVSGSAILSSQQFPLNSDGTWSRTLDRNDEITCNGTASTWWRLQYFVSGRQIGPSRDFVCSQASCVFDGTGALTPITTYPAPPPPSPPLISLQPKVCPFTLATTWTCTHNFGVQPVVAQLYDSNWHEIMSDTPPTATDVNTETAIFLQPQSGYMIVLYAGNSILSTANPNYFLLNPNSDQSQIGDHALTLGGSLSAKRILGCSTVYAGGPFPNIQAAVTDAGTTGCVLILSNYAGVDTYTNPNNVPILDFRSNGFKFTGNLAGSVRADNTDVSLGLNALAAMTANSSAANVAVGYKALQNATPGNGDNTAVGAFALAASVTNGGNTAVGTLAFQALTTNSDNVCVGFQCGQVVTNTSNTVGVGAAALQSLTTGIQNTAIGTHAQLSVTTGHDNTCVGFECLTVNSTGTSNVAVGNFSLNDGTAEADNVAVGVNALKNTTSNFNTAVGFNAGVTATPVNTNVTGAHNTYIGFNSGPASTTQFSNSTAIGDGALVGCSNCMVLGSGENVGIGTSTPGEPLDVVGVIRGSAIFHNGTAATLTGTGACVTRSNQLGGATTGEIKCTGTTGASTITITTGITATNGWACFGSDTTTAAIGIQTGRSTTAPVLTFSSVTANDTLTFGCEAY